MDMTKIEEAKGWINIEEDKSPTAVRPETRKQGRSQCHVVMVGQRPTPTPNPPHPLRRSHELLKHFHSIFTTHIYTSLYANTPSHFGLCFSPPSPTPLALLLHPRRHHRYLSLFLPLPLSFPVDDDDDDEGRVDSSRDERRHGSGRAATASQAVPRLTAAPHPLQVGPPPPALQVLLSMRRRFCQKGP